MNKPSQPNNMDWANIGFEYIKCPYRFQTFWKNGQWEKGDLVTDEVVHLHEGSTALHYSQQCFEGMKAQKTKDGRVVLFRPELNWERMNRTAARLKMPTMEKDFFLEAICKTIAANQEYIPPYGYKSSLYIRPLLIGVGKNLGLKCADEFYFRVFTSPVGSYYKGGKIKPISLKIVNFDRVAPKGIGEFKAGANYSSAMLIQHQARQEGFDEVLFLDPVHNQYIEEAGSANVIIYNKDKELLTPSAKTILPSITRKSAMIIGSDYLKLKTVERPIHFDNEVDSFLEVANCGTAAVISPVGKITDNHNKKHCFYGNGEVTGPIMSEIYNILTSIQDGSMQDNYGWTYEVPI